MNWLENEEFFKNDVDPKIKAFFNPYSNYKQSAIRFIPPLKKDHHTIYLYSGRSHGKSWATRNIYQFLKNSAGEKTE